MTEGAAGPILRCFGKDEAMVALLMDDSIQRLDSTTRKFLPPALPIPTEVGEIAVHDNLAIVSWIDRELRIVRIAGYEMEGEWLTSFADRAEYRNAVSENQEIQTPGSLWNHGMTAEILAIDIDENAAVFVAMNRGIYLIDPLTSNEIWRSEIPEWSPPWEGAQVESHTLSVHLSEDLIYVFDDRGSWACLERSDGSHRDQGRLPFRGKTTGVWKGAAGWAITESRNKIHFLSSEFTLLGTRNVPGPVRHAIKFDAEWYWTGWRHDGGPNGVKPRPEHGVWISLIDEQLRVLSNDGQWSHHGSIT
ncbi:MAG: hypothetical protein DBX05_05980 [Candidatus Poseidoniales archaeon]|nr:MAG: hypothetical protein DBX05_05980 [Candidatus Poseidoniales archaeon]